MSGSNMSQVVLTNEDATMFEQVVQNVSEMFQEVLVDADWVLKSSEGKLCRLCFCPGVGRGSSN